MTTISHPYPQPFDREVHYGIKTVSSSDTLSRAYSPEPAKAIPAFGNLTAVGLVGFLLANTPAAIMLIGLHHAGGDNGNESAASGLYIYMGCLLMVISGIGEWIRGETFSSVVFFSLGGYFGASGATMIPFYNAASGYGADAAAKAAYHDSDAMFLIFMGILLLFFTIVSLRVDVCHVLIFACFTVCFPCLAVSQFYIAGGHQQMARSFRVWGGVMSLSGSIIVWYLLLGSLFEAVDFPIVLPVGDLSKYIPGRTERRIRRRLNASSLRT